MTMTAQAITPVTRLACAITHRCQLACRHCYDDSGPEGSHGTMTTGEWEQLVTEAAAMGVRMVQFIGGEPTMHSGLARLVRHAVGEGLRVEVFSNLVHVSASQWAAFGLPGVGLATSFYTMKREVHERITGRSAAHARTLENIREARRRDIPVRAVLVSVYDDQDTEAARAELAALGVNLDKPTGQVRALGRATQAAPDVNELCGHCGDGRAAVGPDGAVSPCVMSSSWMSAGSVRDAPLADIVRGAKMRELTASIPGPRRDVNACNPDNDGNDCSPAESEACGPDYCNPE